MTTADQVMERAIALAEDDTEVDRAVEELLDCCAGRRVSVIVARQRLEEDLTDVANDRRKADAIQFLDRVLERGSWDLE
jgi:hypothetical protein